MTDAPQKTSFIPPVDDVHTSECPACGGKERWTGNLEIRDDGKTWYEMKCTECHSVGFEWSKEWEDGETSS